MYIVAIVQARMGSMRFPNKVMQSIGIGVPMIEVLLSRLSKSKEIDKIILATSNDQCNKTLVEHVSGLGYDVYQGSENDVLDRYYKAAMEQKNLSAIVRITGDCPLVDPDIVDTVIKKYKSSDAEYVSNTNPPTYPDGMDVEVFSLFSLKMAWKNTKTQYEREHVTPFMRKPGKFKIENISNSKDYSDERLTVDSTEDLEVVREVFKYFHPKIDFSWLDIMKLRDGSPEIFMKNQHLVRNEGGVMSTGQKLWGRAKKVIPGGNMLLSKRAEIFLPGRWPTYFSKAKGCKIWDLDGREYIDMSIMGIGTNILGYGHPEVDAAVQKTIKNGNMSTFNCPEEVYLAEKLVEIHPWADMVRFARSGGEANAIAIRIARAATGKDKVAICGYHGWHDWYLSANLAENDRLDGHLLPGLEPKGVPRNLKDTALPFRYNNFSELATLVRNHDIGVIKMEVQRNEYPKDNFLEKVRSLATEKKIVLIFDECTSGFRETFGGLHKKYGVEPDMAIFGKSLGNGYAITATIGRKEVMEATQSTFISSTFWTERIGPTAALKTLEVMNQTKSWEKITAIGKNIEDKWRQLSKKYKLSIKINGLPSMTGFTFQSNNWLKYKTYITQEMLKNNILATNVIYICTEHTEKYIDRYFEVLEPIFKQIKECEEGKPIEQLLEGDVCHSGFQRLN
jgi:glutamate-1-semialdehyde 2,1-aminomutase